MILCFTFHGEMRGYDQGDDNGIKARFFPLLPMRDLRVCLYVCVCVHFSLSWVVGYSAAATGKPFLRLIHEIHNG